MEREIVLETGSGEQTAFIVSEPTKGCGRMVVLCHGCMSSRESQTNRL